MTLRQPRKLRKDAAENNGRLLAAAVRSGLAAGKFVPLEQIAADAGVGIGTLYRRYPNREALLEAMAVRAYRLILAEAEGALATGKTGHDAINRFLRQTFAHRDAGAAALRSADDRGHGVRRAP